MINQKFKRICIVILYGAIFANTAYAAPFIDTIYNEVNSYRLKHNLCSLKYNSLLSREAQKHSQEMASHLIPFGHDKFNERATTIFGRIPSSGIAENVAYVYTNADDAVKMWLNSYGHRKNIEGNYNLTGIGISTDSAGRIYITQLFLNSSNVTKMLN